MKHFASTSDELKRMSYEVIVVSNYISTLNKPVTLLNLRYYYNILYFGGKYPYKYLRRYFNMYHTVIGDYVCLDDLESIFRYQLNYLKGCEF